jgi:hypothetical protein
MKIFRHCKGGSSFFITELAIKSSKSSIHGRLLGVLVISSPVFDKKKWFL